MRRIIRPDTLTPAEVARSQMRLALRELRDAEDSRARNPERYRLAGLRYDQAAAAFLAASGLPPAGPSDLGA
jgi:hypothetical protein